MTMGRRNRNGDGITNPLYSQVGSAFLGNTAKTSRVVEMRMYQRVLTELALNRFTWNGLPAGMTGRFIEMMLLRDGLCVFYFDRSVERFLSLRATGTGPINIYDNPTKFTVIGNGQFPSKTLKADECVPIWCNYLRIPDMDIVTVFADKLANVSRTIDINLQQQRKPYILTVPEERRLAAMNVLRQLSDGEMAILGNETLDLNNMIQAFNTQVHPQLVLNTMSAKQKIWNECMTLLGINNANQEKRERMVVDEVSANDEQVEMNRTVSLAARREACDAINTRWGLSVSVDFTPSPAASVIDDEFAPREGSSDQSAPSDSGEVI